MKTISGDGAFQSRMSAGPIQVDQKSQMSRTQGSSKWLRNRSLDFQEE